MQLGFSARTYRTGLNLYLVFIGLFTAVFGLINERTSRSWSIGDWLINYQGGFVRRGLAGQAVYLVAHLLHLSPVWLVVLLYLSLYAIFLLAVRSLAFRSSWSLWVLALLLSPATLAFQVLDSGGGFRKELIYLAAFALFVLLLERRQLSTVGASIYIAAAVTAATLSHESLICYAPYFFAALILGGRTRVQAVRQCALPFAAGLIAAAFCTHYLGNLRTAAQICSSLGYKLLPQANQVCSGGAIGYLGYTRQMAREETRTALQQYHFYRLYSGLALLAIVPAAWGSVALARSGFRREIRTLWATAAVCLLGSLILFLYAVDWGRWIYIHVVSIAVLLLWLDGRREKRSPSIALASRAPRSRRIAAGLVLAAYATLWTLPHVAMQAPRFGYIGMVKYVAWFAKNSLHRHAGRE